MNLVVRFLVEICLLLALAWAGAELGSSWVASVALAIPSPLAAVLVWGRWVAPKASHRLTDPRRLLVESVLFSTAAVGLALVGQPLLAAVFAGVTAVNTAVLRLSHAEH